MKKKKTFVDRWEEEADELFSDEGANAMCEYWYKKGRENTIKEIKRLIEGLEDE